MKNVIYRGLWFRYKANKQKRITAADYRAVLRLNRRMRIVARRVGEQVKARAARRLAAFQCGKSQQ